MNIILYNEYNEYDTALLYKIKENYHCIIEHFRYLSR